jgi:hypothetical protein
MVFLLLHKPNDNQSQTQRGLRPASPHLSWPKSVESGGGMMSGGHARRYGCRREHGGQAGPLNFFKAAGGCSSGSAACVARRAHSKGHRYACHARLLAVSTRLRACAWHALRPAWRAFPPTTERSSFFRLPAASCEAGRSKKCLGLFGPKPSRSEANTWRCLYGTRN